MGDRHPEERRVLLHRVVHLELSIPRLGGTRVDWKSWVGTAAGAWAGLSVFIFCPSGDLLHILIGHILPIVGFTLLGVVSIPRILRV